MKRIIVLGLILLLAGCSSSSTTDDAKYQIKLLDVRISGLQTRIDALQNENTKLKEEFASVNMGPELKTEQGFYTNFHEAICKYTDTKKQTVCFLSYSRVKITFNMRMPENILLLEHIHSGKFGVYYVDHTKKDYGTYKLWTIGPKGLGDWSNDMTLYMDYKAINDEFTLYEMNEGGYNLTDQQYSYIKTNFEDKFVKIKFTIEVLWN
jgi:outer membrane murein-binding lipoprotein Lpp